MKENEKILLLEEKIQNSSKETETLRVSIRGAMETAVRDNGPAYSNPERVDARFSVFDEGAGVERYLVAEKVEWDESASGAVVTGYDEDKPGEKERWPLDDVENPESLALLFRD